MGLIDIEKDLFNKGVKNTDANNGYFGYNGKFKCNINNFYRNKMFRIC